MTLGAIRETARTLVTQGKGWSDNGLEGPLFPGPDAYVDHVGPNVPHERGLARGLGEENLMAIPHIAHAPGGLKPPAWTRAVRTRLNNPAMKALGTLLLLVVLGMATGQILGHLLATGIEYLLDVIALD